MQQSNSASTVRYVGTSPGYFGLLWKSKGRPLMACEQGTVMLIKSDDQSTTEMENIHSDILCFQCAIAWKPGDFAEDTLQKSVLRCGSRNDNERRDTMYIPKK